MKKFFKRLNDLLHGYTVDGLDWALATERETASRRW